MLRVQTENPAVRTVVENTARVLLANGASIRPDVVIHESQGNLSVHCDNALPSPLFFIPSHLLIPIGDIEWGIGPQLIVDQTPGLSSTQRELLDLHVQLFNSVGKYRWFCQEFPRGALARYPDVATLFSRIEPRFTLGTTPADFIHTRILSYKAKSDTNAARKPVLMPLVDTMNHHSRGTPFEVDEQGLRVSQFQLEDGGECFVNYGHLRDALQIYSTYGFSDSSVRVATSVPSKVALTNDGFTDFGTLVVRREGSMGYLPNITTNETRITLSKVNFTSGNLGRFTAAFTLPVKSFAIQQGASAEIADLVAANATQQLLDNNRVRIEQLLQVLSEQVEPHCALEDLKSALEIQLHNLDRFRAAVS